MKSIFRTWKFISAHPLGSRNRMGAMRRWIQWQIGTRLLSRPVVMPFVETSVLVIEPGMTGATGNIYCGLHEFADMALVLHFLREEDLFVDVGANVGSYTVLASAVARSHSIAIEPVTETFKRLERNVRANDLEKMVESYCCAAGGEKGRIRFTADQDTTNHAMASGEPGCGIEVPVDTLDHILEERNSAMWKIDVEGFELEVLAGAGQALQNKNLKVILLESDDDGLQEVMRGAGFARAAYEPFTRELRLVRQEAGSGNILWIRDLEYVSKRCKSAPKRTVVGIEF